MCCAILLGENDVAISAVRSRSAAVAATGPASSSRQVLPISWKNLRVRACCAQTTTTLPPATENVEIGATTIAVATSAALDIVSLGNAGTLASLAADHVERVET
jgi:hypothetical protein